MRPSFKILVSFLVVSSTTALTGCSGTTNGSTSGSTSGTATIAISAPVASLPVNGSATLTASVTGTSNTPTWGITGGGGSLSSNAGDTVVYTAPATPPVYGLLGQSGSSVQGIVVLSAGVLQGFGGASAQLSLPITAPSVTTGIAPTSASVALGATEEFYGYAVGSTDNQITWQVNGLTSGSTSTGTVVNTGYYATGGGDYVWPGTYIAPAAMPMSGSTVTVTAVSLSDPTKSSSAVVTLH